MVMIRTITTWPAIKATIATGTCGRPRIRSSEVAPASEASGSAEVSARAYGSGLSIVNVMSAAAPTNTTGMRYGPASTGSPIRAPTSPAQPTRFGPTTAPTVALQTTRLIADARRTGG